MAGFDSIRKIRDEGPPVLLRSQPAKRKRKDATQKAQRRRGVRRKDWELFRRGIRDFTENGGAVRAGGAGEIAGTAVPSFIGQKCESEGFFGVFRDAECRGRQDLDRGEIMTSAV